MTRYAQHRVPVAPHHHGPLAVATARRCPHGFVLHEGGGGLCVVPTCTAWDGGEPEMDVGLTGKRRMRGRCNSVLAQIGSDWAPFVSHGEDGHIERAALRYLVTTGKVERRGDRLRAEYRRRSR